MKSTTIDFRQMLSLYGPPAKIKTMKYFKTKKHLPPGCEEQTWKRRECLSEWASEWPTSLNECVQVQGRDAKPVGV